MEQNIPWLNHFVSHSEQGQRDQRVKPLQPKKNNKPVKPIEAVKPGICKTNKASKRVKTF